MRIIKKMIQFQKKEKKKKKKVKNLEISMTKLNILKKKKKNIIQNIQIY